VEGNIRNFRIKKMGTKEQLKSPETRKLAYTCRHTSRHAILMVID